MLRFGINEGITLLTLLMSGVIIISSLKLVRRCHDRKTKLIIAIVGLLGAARGIHMLTSTVHLLANPRNLQSVIDLVANTLCLIAVALLGVLSREHFRTHMHLRLVEAHHHGSLVPQDEQSKCA